MTKLYSMALIFAAPFAIAAAPRPPVGFSQDVDPKVAAAAVAAAAKASAQPRPVVDLPPKPWTGPVLADGQPDVRGHYGPDKQGTYSLTFPSNGGTGEVLRNRNLKAEGKEIPAWPSRVIDTPDGQIPYQPWARAKQKAIEANIDRPTKQEHLDPQGRCFPDGVVRNPLWTGFEILQYPGYVVIAFEQNHTWRVIPLDGRPHIPGNIKLWMSDSRGRWDGNTLVVDVTSSNSKSRLGNIGDFASDKVHIVERYTFTPKSGFEWRVTLTDPTVYTRPWTIWAQFNRAHLDEPEWEPWEQACHEGEKNALGSLLFAPEKPARAKRTTAKR